MAKRLEAHFRDWEEMAAQDPFWAVLTGKRDWELEEFFASGEADVAELLSAAERLGVPRERLRALDFGCGVGRVTRHLGKYFAECWGVDVSQTMLQLAEKHNPDCRFHLNRRSDLRDFPESHFDLVYSVIVLQHQPDLQMIENYIREFIRILRPQGLLAFHLPSRIPFRYWLAPRRRAYRVLHAAGVGPERLRNWKLFPMRMTAVRPERVQSVIECAEGRLMLAEPHRASGPIPSRMYYCTKD
jgi:SAM-dependent methyltransferase